MSLYLDGFRLERINPFDLVNVNPAANMVIIDVSARVVVHLNQWVVCPDKYGKYATNLGGNDAQAWYWSRLCHHTVGLRDNSGFGEFE
jgi:hypothetical protein